MFAAVLRVQNAESRSHKNLLGVRWIKGQGVDAIDEVPFGPQEAPFLAAIKRAIDSLCRNDIDGFRTARVDRKLTHCNSNRYTEDGRTVPFFCQQRPLLHETLLFCQRPSTAGVGGL